MKEQDLYSQVSKWLYNYLNSWNKRKEIIVKDTHKVNLSDFIVKNNLQNLIPQYSAYDIKVDITGIIKDKNNLKLVFVECKIKPIRLLDVGQLLGYSLVAKPIEAFLISPRGTSEPLYQLLKIYGRYDILSYDKNRNIKILTWDIQKKEPVWSSILPPGYHRGKL
ncbi:hypothetical protein QI155_03170 [Thermodesulfovibrio sp. 1176]|uniref:hypothetical protein n=1 Tax=Thermodesulfovibrio sp. 1176 TaxID=3043424 RepID=UPI0024826F91|nr:hypothetical protein [Thermodesulfovibrio sp. 1176]MDI1471524.1 hypothetical protein [Thermodesulfovibrio sp. 1176]